MEPRGSLVWYLVGAAILVAGAMTLREGTTHDLSQPPGPDKTAYPKLPSDSLPRKTMGPLPNEPFNNGWTETSPADAVAAEAERRIREIAAEQERQSMMQNAPPPADDVEQPRY